MGHPQPIKVIIVKKCPEALRIYGNIVGLTLVAVADTEGMYHQFLEI